MASNFTYFNDLVLSWLQDIKASHALSTYTKYEQLSRNYILPFFDGIITAQMSQKELERFRSFLIRYSSRNISVEKSLSFGNIKCIFMIINNVMQQAYDAQILSYPIFITAKFGKAAHMVKVFSSSEQRDFELYLMQKNSLCALGIYLCLYTGLRLGELCSLRWSDLNLDEHYIHVQRTIQRLPSEDSGRRTELMVSTPKSASSIRFIPIPAFLLSRLKVLSASYIPGSFLVTGTRRPMEPRTLQYRYKRYLAEAKVKYLNFHSLRHTFATRCIMVGMDPKTLSEILGHSDIKITLEYYFHSSFEFKKEQMNLLDALV